MNIYANIIDLNRYENDYNCVLDMVISSHKEIPVTGIVLQSDCNIADSIIGGVSNLHNLHLINISIIFLYLNKKCDDSRKCYSQNYNWLMLDSDDNNRILKILNYTKLSVDTQMTYANLNQSQTDSNLTKLSVFDVYNSGQHIGGKLNVTPIGWYVYNELEKSFYFNKSVKGHVQTIFENRKDMSDVTMRVGFVVILHEYDIHIKIFTYFFFKGSINSNNRTNCQIVKSISNR